MVRRKAMPPSGAPVRETRTDGARTVRQCATRTCKPKQDGPAAGGGHSPIATFPAGMQPRSRPARAPSRRGHLAALALAAAGCGGAAAPEPPAPPATTCPIPVAVAAPTFTAHVLPALRQSCGAGDATTCHGTPSPTGHVSYAPSLTAAAVLAGLKGVAPANAPAGAGWLLVAPGEPGRSWLLAKVTQDDPGGAGQAYGNRMPLQAPNLCGATVETLTAWVSQGAIE